MKGPAENTTGTESPIAGKDLTRVGESVTTHRAGSGRPHKGLDLFAQAGSPVRSVGDGKVLRVVDGASGARSSQQRAGWFVDILGTDGLVYRYLHLGEKPPVRANQIIAAGITLGTVGTSGIRHARPHVHFEIRRGDYSDQQRDYGEPVDPLTILPLGNFTNGGFRMADMNSQARGTDTAASIRPVAVDLNAPDARAALAFLVSKGWTTDEVEQLLNQHARAEATDNQVEDHLLSLGWSKSDVARLLVGPEQAHKTAESLFRQHAANSDEDQQALLNALVQAGAKNIKPDPSLLSGLNVAHLSPENPSDLKTLISQFASLPDVQKQRFLLLLDSQKPNKKATAGSTTKTSGSDGALPVVKSGIDLLNTALRGLLGATKDGKKGASGSPKGSLSKGSSSDESDSEDSSSPADDNSGEDANDIPNTNEESDSSSVPDDQVGLDDERAPD